MSAELCIAAEIYTQEKGKKESKNYQKSSFELMVFILISCTGNKSERFEELNYPKEKHLIVNRIFDLNIVRLCNSFFSFWKRRYFNLFEKLILVNAKNRNLWCM